VGSGEVSRGEKMLQSGTDPESCITESTFVYEDEPASGAGGPGGAAKIGNIDRLRVGWLNGLRGVTRAEDAQRTPTQSRISPSILVYEDYQTLAAAGC